MSDLELKHVVVVMDAARLARGEWFMLDQTERLKRLQSLGRPGCSAAWDDLSTLDRSALAYNYLPMVQK